MDIIQFLNDVFKIYIIYTCNYFFIIIYFIKLIFHNYLDKLIFHNYLFYTYYAFFDKLFK